MSVTPPNPGSSGQPLRGSSFARLSAFSKATLSESWIAPAFLIVSFVIAQILVVAMHVQTTRMWQGISEVQLARDLNREFNDREKGYLRVANSIEGCRKLYKLHGGKFSHLEINNYLGFFADLDLFMARGLLTEELAGHFFGAFILEAHAYPEIQSYIAQVRENFSQPDAYAGFDRIAKRIESDPRFTTLAEFAKTMCAKEKAEADENTDAEEKVEGETGP